MTRLRHTLPKLLRAVQRRWVGWLLGLTLLTHGCTRGIDTTIGRAMWCTMNSCCGARSLWLPVVATDEGLLVLARDDQKHLYNASNDIGAVTLRPWRRERGFWAATTEIRDTSLRFYPHGAAFTPDEQAHIRTAIANSLNEKGEDPLFVATLRAGGGEFEQVIWTGYLHNAAALCLGSVFLLSLGGIPRRIITERRADARARGLCPQCRYDLRGETDAGCPECGWGR